MKIVVQLNKLDCKLSLTLNHDLTRQVKDDIVGVLEQGLVLRKIEPGFLIQCTLHKDLFLPATVKRQKHLERGLVGVLKNILYVTMVDGRCQQMDECGGVIVGRVDNVQELKAFERVPLDRQGRPLSDLRVDKILVDDKVIYEFKEPTVVPKTSFDGWDREQRLRLKLLGDTASLSSSSSSSRTIFIARLSPHTRSTDLRDIFSRFGTITDCNVVPAKRIAFITFSSILECDEAVKRMDGVVVDESRIRVDYAHSGRRDQSESRIQSDQ